MKVKNIFDAMALATASGTTASAAETNLDSALAAYVYKKAPKE